MSPALKPDVQKEMESFFHVCMANPSILNQPEYSTVKTFIEFFGGQIPKVNQQENNESPSKKSEDANISKESEPQSEPESEEESDLELDMSAVIGNIIYLKFHFFYIFFVIFFIIFLINNELSRTRYRCFSKNGKSYFTTNRRRNCRISS